MGKLSIKKIGVWNYVIDAGLQQQSAVTRCTIQRHLEGMSQPVRRSVSNCAAVRGSVARLSLLNRVATVCHVGMKGWSSHKRHTSHYLDVCEMKFENRDCQLTEKCVTCTTKEEEEGRCVNGITQKKDMVKSS